MIIENNGTYLFQCNGVEFPIFKEDVGKSIAQLEALGTPALQTIMLANHYPVEPWVYEGANSAKIVLMGIVQNAWHLFFNYQVPERIQKNFDKIVAAYKEKLLMVAAKQAQAAEKAKTVKAENAAKAAKEPKAAKPAAPPRVVSRYQLVEAQRAVWTAFTKQKQVMVKAMLELNAPATTEEIAIRCVFEGSKQPALTVVRFYVNDFKNKGLIEVSNGPAATN